MRQYRNAIHALLWMHEVPYPSPPLLHKHLLGHGRDNVLVAARSPDGDISHRGVHHGVAPDRMKSSVGNVWMGGGAAQKGG